MTARDLPAAGQPGWRFLIAGTGGQGVITAARLLSEFFVGRGQRVVSGQLHGMAQRGGAVQSTVLVDSGPSPALGRGRADFVLGLEPVETARALPFVSAGTVVLMNTTPVAPFVLALNRVLETEPSAYPPLEELAARIRKKTRRLALVAATAPAREVGSVKTLNVVMLGCLFGCGLLPFAADDFIGSVLQTAPAGWARANRPAFESGVELGRTLDLNEEARCP